MKSIAIRKQENRQKLEEIADGVGDLILSQMFWHMFDDLSATKQEYYIKWAQEIARETR